MKRELFAFLKRVKTKVNGGKNVDYLELIDSEKASVYVQNFFERSVIENISHKELMRLVDSINRDIRFGVFDMDDYHSLMNIMNSKQLNSKTHKEFLKIIDNNFGKSAVHTLKQRKNINIFNLNEVHVLHQEVFDTYGPKFVNRILNLDLTPESLIVIKDILTDKEKKADFKYLYDFYNKNIGDSHVDFERMIRGYVSYKDLLHEIRVNNKKITKDQKETLIEILKDYRNMDNIRDILGLDTYYVSKDNKYKIEKQWSSSLFKNGEKKAAIERLSQAFFKNFYGMQYNFDELRGLSFSILDNSVNSICDFFDMDGIIQNEDLLNERLSKEEQDMLKDMKDIVVWSENKDEQDQAYNKLLSYCEKYENKGNTTSRVGINIFDKLSTVYEKLMLNTLSKSDEIEKRANSNEKGVYVVENPQTKEGIKIDFPVYKFDGADFAFLSTTNLTKGLSGNEVIGDIATSWFEYENGTSHIPCSYSTQDCLANLEFNKVHGFGVTYFFDDAEIFTMGADDIFTPSKPRISNVSSLHLTKFMTPQNMVEASKGVVANEIAVSRYKYDEEVKYAGKIIPSGILCSEDIYLEHVKAAESFTKYCVEKGLRPEGWKMPIVVVDKKRYVEINEMKAKKLIVKNSEYFVHDDENKKEEKENFEKFEKEKTVEARGNR